MKNTVLITGANGFIAKHLIPILQESYNVKLVTRTPKASNEFKWDLDNWTIDEAALDQVDYIVHLSGSKLNDGTPLTKERMQLVRDTRIGAADFLREKLKARNQKIKALVSASAIGYYGYSDSTVEIDENGHKGVGFGANLSDDWEKAADRFKIDRVAEHVSKIRVSLVLGNDGGIFPSYKKMVKSNSNIALQANESSYPWNHVEDMAGIFAFAVANHLDGVYNSVAPKPASMQDIFKAIANTISDTHYPIAEFTGQHLVAHKIVQLGYRFKYPDIEQAVNHLMAADRL